MALTNGMEFALDETFISCSNKYVFLSSLLRSFLLHSLFAICGEYVCFVLWLVDFHSRILYISTPHMQNDAAINLEMASERKISQMKESKKTLLPQDTIMCRTKRKLQKGNATYRVPRKEEEKNIRSEARWICLLRLVGKCFILRFGIDNMICCLVFSENVFFPHLP